ncbi:hypothetical protein P3W43_14360 [Salinicola salarius]|uniref:hypothetical protein n=1 Tax=Salinicola salarius TaxID=430457 RepID=UPI0023E445F4|nr:hypothetical protein [Salinicola salarius]MDF3920041.1 hypothetical protein [Salinicola salarius]
MQRWERYSVESLIEDREDERGSIFLSPKGQRQHGNVKILNAGVDTVRQLYAGKPCLALFDRIIEIYQQGRGATIDLFGSTWVVGAGTSTSGFRYRLQNNDLGVIVLFYARHTKVENIGTHLKIELSPHFIQERSTSDVQTYLDTIAKELLAYVEPMGCAVHLALDVQGWEPPSDFMDRFVTRSKRIVRKNAISDFEITSGEVATQYAYGQSYLFGSAGALQCAIYNKTREAHARDKIHFWESIWERASSDDPTVSDYDPERDVWRVEMRFHQSVLREFAQGIPCNVDTGECLDMDHGFQRFIDVVPHLTGLWRTALKTYRLDHSRGLIDSAWQLLQEDARFYDHEPHFLYKRARKAPGLGNEKNVALVVGNLISLYARQGFNTHQAMHYLTQCGAWDDIANYYRRRGIDAAQLRLLISQRLVERRLLGKAA